MNRFPNQLPFRSLRVATLWLTWLASVGAARLWAADAPGASVFWEPYVYDPATVVLCHYDGRQETPTGALLEAAMLSEDGGMLLSGETANAKSGPTAANDVLMKGSDIPLLGACEEVADEGRFGGGLRLAGQDGRIAVRGAPGQGWTLEAWFKTARMPAERATLIELSGGRHPLRVSLMNDGRIAAQWLAAKQPLLTEWRAEVGEWFHLALVWRPTAFHGDAITRAELRMLVNGQPKLHSGEQAADAFRQTLAQTAVVGNNAKGESGFDGWLDELRLSTAARDFYALDLGWVDAAGSRPAPAGRPYFRDPRDLLLWLPFDDALAPAFATEGVALSAGTPTSAAALKEEAKGWGFGFGAGVARQGLLLLPGDKGVRYGGVTVPRSQGTIAFWIRPRNWDNAREWNRFAKFPQEFAPIFRLEQGGKKVLALTWVKTPNNNFYPNPVAFNPGLWQHLALTWDNGAISRIYLNGKPWTHWGTANWDYDPKGWDEAQPLELVLPPGKDALYLDDFRLYRRALAPSEVANLVALYDRRAELKPLPDFDDVYAVNGVIGTASVTLWPLLEDYARVMAATMTVEGPGIPNGLAETRVEVKPDSPLVLDAKTGPLGFGEFKLTVKALDANGDVVASKVIHHTRTPPAWWQSQAGVSDKVMPEWEPVRVQGAGFRVQDSAGESPGADGRRQASTGAAATAGGAVVSISLRDIHLAASGLPEKIVSVGEDILAGPVELMATVAGKEAPLKPVAGSFKAETRGEVKAEFAGQAAGAGVTADIKGCVEFDGFMWFEVKVSGVRVQGSGAEGGGLGGEESTKLATKADPEPSTINHQPLTISSLRLRLPYAPDAARFLHAWNGNGWFREPMHVRFLNVPPAPGPVFSSLDTKLIRTADGLRGSFLPYVMLTGDRRGMAWFAENDKGWTQSTNTPGVAVTRTADAVVLTLQIISEPVDLNTPRTFAFGLHPIPVKPCDPARRGWESWTVAPDGFMGHNLKNDKAGVFNSFGRSPKEMDWEAAGRRVSAWVGDGDPRQRPDQPRSVMVAPGLYQNLRGLADVPADTVEWEADWFGHGWGQGRDSLRYTPELVDFSAWIFNEWVRRGFCRGLYLDDCWNTAQRVVPGPAAYKLADGHVQPGFDWRCQRQYLWRLRQVFYDNNLTPHMCAHITHTLYPMWGSFFDVVLDGEDHYVQDPREQRDFMDSWSPARMRFMNPEKWGPSTTWLWWRNDAAPGWQSFPTRQWQCNRAYTAGLLVHDLAWTVGIFRTELDAQWIAEARIRLDPSIRFVGYWDSAPVASHPYPALYVSAWKRPGWCAVALANYGQERVEAQVRLDLNAMGFDGVAPEAVTIRDVDRSLIRYFDDDVTKLKKPELPNDEDPTGKPAGMEDFNLDAPLTLKERTAADPDGQFEWRDGVLHCPVRRHDFRLFEFKVPAGQ